MPTSHTLAGNLISAYTAAHAGWYHDKIPYEAYFRPVDEVLRFSDWRRCDLPIVNANNLSWTEIKDKYEDGAVLTGLMDHGWLAQQRTRIGTKGAFLEAYGDALTLESDARYDPSDRYLQPTSVRSYLQKAASMKRNSLAITYDTKLERALFKKAKLPRLLQDFDLRLTGQLAGAVASGTHFHSHAKTWLAMLHGRKAWWIAPSPAPQAITDEKAKHTAHPCSWLNGTSPPDLKFCVQYPGEVIYFGDFRFHAVCNLDEFVLAFGAQGRLPPTWTSLDRALHRGDVDAVAHLLTTGNAKSQELVDVQRDRGRFAAGATPLYSVARKGDADLVAFLLERRADVHGMPLEKTKPIHDAKGHRTVTLLLLARRAEVNVEDDKGFSPLHRATSYGRLDVVKLLLAHRSALAKPNNEGRHPLHLAVGGGHVAVTEFLLERRADLESPAKDLGSRPLHDAAEIGHATLVNLLLQRKAQLSPRAIGSGRATPLHIAASSGHVGVTRLLIEQRANIQDEDAHGQLPLERAAFNGRLEVSRLLLEFRATIGDAMHLAAGKGHTAVVNMFMDFGADVHSVSQQPLTAGMQPLHAAAQLGHVATAQLLLQLRADTKTFIHKGKNAIQDAAEKGDFSVIKQLIRARASLHELGGDVEDDKGFLPLHRAASFGRLDVVKLLLAQRSALTWPNRDGREPLHLAVGGGHVTVTEFLLERRADLESPVKELGSRPLHDAAEIGHATLVKFLLERKAKLSPRAIGHGNATPLHIAAYSGHVGVTRLLTERGAKMQDADAHGQLPLERAASTGRFEVSRLLLELRAAIGDAMHVAAAKGHAAIINLFMDFRGDINSVSQQSSTADMQPLHAAAQLGHAATVRLLLRLRSNLNSFTHKGKHAIHYAAEKGDLSVIKQLIYARANKNAVDRKGSSLATSAFQANHQKLNAVFSQHSPNEL